MDVGYVRKPVLNLQLLGRLYKMANKFYNIYIVGLGGQGVLTIGDLITEVALKKGYAVNFYPTKGMSQRGGFVQGQIRIGDSEIGPNIPPKGADLVIAMERSEALKAIRFMKPGGDFVLYDLMWAPTAVLLGKADYPSLDLVKEEIAATGAHTYILDSGLLPEFNGVKVRENLFVLGLAVARTGLKDILNADAVREVIRNTWPKGAEENLFAFNTGYNKA
jgi:indolepyruvate ferredoxin oxidoreductase beta subunit